MMKRFAFGFTAAALLTGTTSATVIEDFEDATVAYTTNQSEFSDGSGDFFTRTDGSNISGGYSVTGFNGSSYFAAQDIDGDGSIPAIQTFSGIDITGLTDLEFSVLLAEDDDGSNQDWDLNDDIVSFEYQIDNGGYSSLFDVLTTTPTSGTFNGQPEVNGTFVTDTFTEFTAAIAGTGSSLDIRITWDLDSGDEDLAIDDISVTGVPEPGSLALLGLGGLLIARRRRG